MSLSPTSPKLLYKGCGCRDSGRRPRRHRCLERGGVDGEGNAGELYALAPQLLLRLFCLVAVAVRRCMAFPLEAVSADAPFAATSVPADIIPADAAVDATIAADADAKARPRPRYPALGGRCVCLEFLPMLEGVVSGYVLLPVSHTVAGAVTAVVIGAGGGAFWPDCPHCRQWGSRRRSRRGRNDGHQQHPVLYTSWHSWPTSTT